MNFYFEAIMADCCMAPKVAAYSCMEEMHLQIVLGL